MPEPVIISAAVEGIVDEAVARRLIAHAGGSPGAVYGKQGKSALRDKIGGYNKAARHAPWFVLVDLNGDADCAPPLRESWLAAPAPQLCFRVAVRQVEAWLMADREALAKYLGIAQSRAPADPEALQNAKVEMVNLARRSRRKDVRADMVPREGSGRSVGPAYAARLIEYVESHWRPEVAAQGAESLRRAIACLQRLIESAA
ncbi:MAG TPA: hypothetical protein VFD84_16885 [Candidatus Binatia bacterium]|nr:hypothetical protein [Candidatus Binatia bacterium]